MFHQEASVETIKLICNFSMIPLQLTIRHSLWNLACSDGLLKRVFLCGRHDVKIK